MKKTAIIFVLLCCIIPPLLRCTAVKYNNPLDTKGTNYAGDSMSVDDDRDGIANYFDDDDGDGIPNYMDPDYKHYHQTDFTKPVITFVGGDTVIVAQDDPRGVLALDTVKAEDNVDGNITAKVVKPDIFTSRCSTYNVIYTVKDVAGNTAEKARTIIVDCNPPVITLYGDNPMSLPKGAKYVEPGADAEDDIDGPMPAAGIIITGTVNTTRQGFDTITYSATDRAGNNATKQRVVEITVEADTTPPRIVLKGSSSMTVWKDSAYVEPGYTATDNVDGDITSKVVVTGGPVNTAVLGTVTLTYTVTDQAGYTATQTRTITIKEYIPGIDSVKPKITLKGSPDTSILVGTTWTEPGYTATDNVDGDITQKVVVTGGPVSTVSPHSYTLLYAVSDMAGNATQVARIVRVTGQSMDTTPPVITLKGCTVCTTNVGTQFTDPGVTATDNVDGTITDSVKRVVTNKATGAEALYSTFWQTVGVYNFTYRVYDKAGNPATAVVRQVTVKDTMSPNSLLVKYGLPLSTALPAINVQYNGGATTDGAGAPNVSNMSQFQLNWDAGQNTVYQFRINTKDGNPSYSVDLTSKISGSNTFNQAKPGFTLSSSGFTGLDGDYYIKADATQCVWVKKDGSFAVIFAK